MHTTLDDIDLKILSILMKDAKTPYTDIAKTLFVSSGTVHVRMKKMEENGIIRSFNLQLNYQKLGYDITAFLGIYLNKSSQYDIVAKETGSDPRNCGCPLHHRELLHVCEADLQGHGSPQENIDGEDPENRRHHPHGNLYFIAGKHQPPDKNKRVGGNPYHFSLITFSIFAPMRIFNNILETIGNTPIVKLNKITSHIPATVCVKIESFNPGHSTKDRMAVKWWKMRRKTAG